MEGLITMDEQLTFEFEQRPTIKGFPELRWTGKRPYRSTQYYPAQLRESYGEEQNGWINKIFWGDNLQVMSHLLKEYRGKIDLIYIYPPFDSKADYKRKIEVKMLVKLHLIAPRLKKSSMGIYGQMTNISSLCTKDLRLCAICYLKRDAYMFIAIGTRFIILD